MINPNRYCIIMAGGIGSRFWPISRRSTPKQFLDILGTGKSFIRHTYERFAHIIPPANFLVVTNSQYKAQVLAHLPELDERQVLCEPVGRNTAPCIAYAAWRLKAVNPEATMIITPADHLILNETEFCHVIDQSADFVEQHHNLMTIGIRPNRPATGYGYIQIDNQNNAEGEGIYPVKTFTEKPNLELARTFVESGEFFWNAGIFIWKTASILECFAQLLPDLHQTFSAIAPYFNTSGEQDQIQRIYPECRNISIDFGIMEKATNVYVRCSDFGWSDIGTWGSLYEYAEKDPKGNAVAAQCMLYDTQGCIVKGAPDKLIVIEGLTDYIVVDHGNVLMICPKNNEQNVKRFIDDAKFQEGDEYI
ncbi:MAG: mannose-1-phosphate guanylyltransferase [Alistipes sp.]|nr:mannose-1-phosphate guanylyltransferase [Alistipes sp.]